MLIINYMNKNDFVNMNIYFLYIYYITIIYLIIFVWYLGGLRGSITLIKLSIYFI